MMLESEPKSWKNKQNKSLRPEESSFTIMWIEDRIFQELKCKALSENNK